MAAACGHAVLLLAAFVPTAVALERHSCGVELVPGLGVGPGFDQGWRCLISAPPPQKFHRFGLQERKTLRKTEEVNAASLYVIFAGGNNWSFRLRQGLHLGALFSSCMRLLPGQEGRKVHLTREGTIATVHRTPCGASPQNGNSLHRQPCKLLCG